MTIDPRESAAYLRELAIQVERGEVDQLFIIAHQDASEGGFVTQSFTNGGTNVGAAHAAVSIVRRIECCTDSSCLPGSVKLQVLAVIESFGITVEDTPQTIN